jgi:hypothetical protein
MRFNFQPQLETFESGTILGVLLDIASSRSLMAMTTMVLVEMGWYRGANCWSPEIAVLLSSLLYLHFEKAVP